METFLMTVFAFLCLSAALGQLNNDERKATKENDPR
jgi:hypothetical protein